MIDKIPPKAKIALYDKIGVSLPKFNLNTLLA